jgi:hypothetical protein
VHVHRIGVEPHSISVVTARDDMVDARIDVHASAPTADPGAEHIVEADLDAPTGKLSMSSPGVDPADGSNLTVPAGLLRARVSYIPCEPPAVETIGGPGEHFRYRIDLWPVRQARGLVVLKTKRTAGGLRGRGGKPNRGSTRANTRSWSPSSRKSPAAAAGKYSVQYGTSVPVISRLRGGCSGDHGAC